MKQDFCLFVPLLPKAVYSTSPFVCNVLFFNCEHFVNVMSIDDLMSYKFNAQSMRDICLQRRTVTSYCRDICLLQLLMLKRGILLVTRMVFSTRDIDDVMRNVC